MRSSGQRTEVRGQRSGKQRHPPSQEAMAWQAAVSLQFTICKTCDFSLQVDATRIR